MRSRPTGYDDTYAWCDDQPCESQDFVSVPIESLSELLRELADVVAHRDSESIWANQYKQQRDEARRCLREAIQYRNTDMSGYDLVAWVNALGGHDDH